MQLELFSLREPQTSAAVTPDLTRVLSTHAPIAVGVSGGKDSQAAALAVAHYREQAGHRGPFALIHSDLGSVEWNQSLPVCERLAEHLGAELIVVRRPAGGMMERWESRWASSVARYRDLLTMRLVLPWSTPGMRFCTSELKVAVINAELRRRAAAGGHASFINACGIRREESVGRRLKPVADIDSSESTQRVTLWRWNPIIEWVKDDVLRSIAGAGLELHEAYRLFGMSRVSCRFCIMSSAADLRAAALAPESAELYRRMVALETVSTFAFHGSGWLADVAPALLDASQRDAVRAAKENAAARVRAEERIPQDLLHTRSGWPSRMPTPSEADLVAEVRQAVSTAVGLSARYLDGQSVHARFAELIGMSGRN